MAKTCSHKGCNYHVFSEGLCKSHWQRQYGKPLKKSMVPLKRTPLKRSTKAIPKISEKRAEQRKRYKPLRDQFLKDKPLCELKVDDGCRIFASELHHLEGEEGEKLLDMSKCKSACRHCHSIVTEHSKAAIENGQSLSRHKKHG